MYRHPISQKLPLQQSENKKYYYLSSQAFILSVTVRVSRIPTKTPRYLGHYMHSASFKLEMGKPVAERVMAF